MPLDSKTIFSYFSQILDGLAHIHSYGLIHRDIKPSNILIGPGNTIKIGDFGVARSINSSELIMTMVGTPYYLAPEIILGIGYTTQADIWSVGCVFYELLTLKPLFECQSLCEL